MAYKSQHKATLTDSRAPVEKVGSNSTHLEVKGLRSKYAVLLAAATVFLAASARGQETNGLQGPDVATGSSAANDTNAANNPVNPQLTIDLQNYVMPSPGGYPGSVGDQGLFRVSVPMDLFGLHQFVRTILPINTPVSTPGGPTAGVGDLTVYDLVLSKVHGITIGVGPLIAAPTARSEAYGSGKWQAGAAGIVLKPFNWGLLGVLINYQHSFSGNSSSPVGQITNRTTNCSLQLPSWLLPAVYGSVDIQ